MVVPMLFKKIEGRRIGTYNIPIPTRAAATRATAVRKVLSIPTVLAEDP
jgi:hypothetical protein